MVYRFKFQEVYLQPSLPAEYTLGPFLVALLSNGNLFHYLEFTTTEI